jgi:ABC-type Fe3+ transport system substrate-binding protein
MSRGSQGVWGVCLLMVLAACEDGRARLTVLSPLDAGVRDWVEATFEDAHPEMDLRWHAVPPDDLASALRSGDVSVVWGTPSWILAAAARDDLLEPPVAGPSWAASVPKGAGDPGNRWLPAFADPVVLAFNPDSIARSRAPRDWPGLLHPQWTGDLAWPDANASEYGAVIVASRVSMGLAETGDLNAGFDWLSRADAIVGDYVPDDDELARRLSGGFALVAPLPLSIAERARLEGRSLEYRVPEDETPTLVYGVAVLSGAEDPAAAAAFVDWVGLPEQVTGLAVRFALMPVDPTAAAAVPGSALASIVAGLRYAIPPADTLAEHLDEWVRRWRTTIQGRHPRVLQAALP